MKSLAGYACFIVALGALVAFEYLLYLIVQVGTCASGPPYMTARPCPANTGQLVVILLVSFGAALGGGIAASTLLGGKWGSVLWAVLFVPPGVGFGTIAHANGNAIVAWGLAVMFVVMGLAPFFVPQAAQR